jgi:hypothetical protein
MALKMTQNAVMRGQPSPFALPLLLSIGAALAWLFTAVPLEEAACGLCSARRDRRLSPLRYPYLGPASTPYLNNPGTKRRRRPSPKAAFMLHTCLPCMPVASHSPLAPLQLCLEERRRAVLQISPHHVQYLLGGLALRLSLKYLSNCLPSAAYPCSCLDMPEEGWPSMGAPAGWAWCGVHARSRTKEKRLGRRSAPLAQARKRICRSGHLLYLP